MRKYIASILSLLFLGYAPIAQAAFFHPDMEVYTVKTDHFYIHYQKEQSAVAGDLVLISERVHAKLSDKLKWTPWGRTHLVLVDSTDRANGLATVIPANYVLLYVAVPDADSSLDNYQNYLELLFTHEYTHILHMDQHNRWADPAHWIFGKIVAPNGLTPGWMREGIAAWEESVETGRGRGNSSYSDMLLRISILENNFPHIDEASGLGIPWPGTDSQYIFGVKFWQWLAQKYGEESIQKYAETYASGLWLFSLNNKARRVYGKSFYKLWKEWKQDLTSLYEGEKEKIGQRGITPFEPVAAKKLFQSYPTANPAGKEYAYLEDSLDEPSHIVIAGERGSEPKIIRRNAFGQMSYSRDGGKFLAYASLLGIEKYKAFSDVFIYDFEKKISKRVFEKGGEKKSLRASDPDFAPMDNGARWVVMVRTNGSTDNLYVNDLEKKKGYFLTRAPRYTQFSNPRFSPDGRHIVVSRRDPKGNRDIVLYSSKGKEISKITHDKASDNHPVWSPSGHSIFYESDKSGIPNIYRHDLSDHRQAMVTNVVGGVYQPQISADGKDLLVKYYTSKGHGIYRTSLLRTETASKKPMTQGYSLPDLGPPPAEDTVLPGSKKYSAFPQVLVPRYLYPTFLTLDDAFLVGFSTGRYDPLYRHSWALYTNYRSDAAFVGAGGSYSYFRRNPSYYVGFARYVLNWGNIFGIGADFFEQRLQGFAGTTYTKGYQGISAGYFFENRDNFSAIPAPFILPTLDRYAGLRFDYTYARYKKFPQSISQEDGPFFKIGVDVTDAFLGSAEVNEQTVVTGDLRYYWELPWADHHVFGLRTAGGYVFGDQEFSGTFRFGGPFGEGTMAGYSSRLFPFRGLPGVTFAGDRVLLFSGEYRLPIASVNRGIGTWPVFLRKIHLSLFSDFGDSWLRNGKDDVAFFEDFFLSLGTELKGDLVLGYGLPLTTRLGYAVIVKNRDQIAGLTDALFGNDIRNGTFYFQFGTAF